MKNILLILTFLAALAIAPNASAQVTLKADTVNINCASSDTFLVPIRVTGFQNIGSFQFTLMWDTAKLDYAYTTPINPLLLGNGVDFDSNTTQINAGKIAFLWTKTTGASLPDSTIIFNLAFRRIGGSFASLMFVNSPVPIEVADANANILNVTTLTGGVKPIDDKAPLIICPANVTVQGNGPTPVNGIALDSIADNCAPLANIGWTSSGATSTNQPNDPDASGFAFNIGTSTVTYTGTDVGGNTATCSFTVTVELSLSTDTLTIIAQNATVSCGQMVSINITALNFDSIGSLQFSIGWNQAVLQYASVSNLNPALQLILGDNFNTSQTANGLLAFLWTANAPEGETLPPGATIFTINFNLLGAGGSGTTLAFGDVPVIREVFSNTGPGGSPEEAGAYWINGSVTVVDNVPPTLDCPDNVAVDLPTGNTNVQVNGLEPDALSDNCPGNINLIYVRTGATSGSGTGNANGLYNPGVTTVTYTATDAAGNTSTCSFSVTVNSAGILTLLIDSVQADCQGAGLVQVDVFVENWDDIFGLQFSVEWDETVLGFDNVGNFNPSLNLTPGDFGLTQTNNGILSFFAGGPSSNWPQLPDSSVIFSIFFDVSNASATSAISFTGFIEAINSQINTVPVTTVNGFFSAGADNTPPTVTCQDTLVNAINLACSANVDILSLVMASDACSGVDSITWVPAGNVFPSGVTQVTAIVKDSAGNLATCVFNVSVRDNTIPSISCPSGVTATAQGTNCFATVDWQTPIATDPCGPAGLVVFSNYTQDSLFPIGQTLVFYTATDLWGNSSNCSFLVTVADTAKPVLVCPDNVVADGYNSILLADCSAIVSFSSAIQLLPDCDTIPVTSDYISPDTFPVGTTTVTFEAVDGAQNVSTCSITITVLDLVPPTLTCPPADTVTAQQNACGANVDFPFASAADDCSSTVTITSDSLPGTFFPVGTTPVTYTATDAAGNSSQCVFTITVEETVPPILLGCPQDPILVLLPPGECSSSATWSVPQATDNCLLDALVGSHVPGSNFFAGTTVVTYTTTDVSGNSTTCTFRVIIQDEIPPVLSNCPPDVTINNAKPCGEEVCWTPPTATDNCTPDSTILLSSSHVPCDTFFNGMTTVIIIAQDASANFDTCTFTITINAGAQPGFNPADPPDISQTTTTCSAVVTWQPPIPVGFCGVKSLTSTHQPGDTFPVGVTTVTYTAIDSVTMLPTSVSFTVTVQENEPPVINCPQGPIVVNVGGGIISDPSEFLFDVDTVAGCAGLEIDFDNPEATDNCGIVSYEQTTGLPPGVFPIGIDTLTFIAQDASGNTTTCIFVIEVQGLPALNAVSSPRFGCLNEPVTITATPIAGATYTWMFGNQTLSDTDNSIFISEFAAANEGTYTVVANVGGCTTQPSSVTVTLAQEPDAVEDTDISVAVGDTVLFNVLQNDILVPPSDFDIANVGSLQGLVNLGNGNFAYVGTMPGEFQFLYTVCSKSCPELCDQTSVRIVVRPDGEEECKVPNIFTPNGDGVNDWLEIPCLDSQLYPENSLVVYNQWGDKVYEAAPYFNDQQSGNDKIPWRGTLNGNAGQDLPDATYFFIFRPGPGEPVIKGFIEIIR
jgi:gliding motility-associated-like protein